MTEKVPLLGEIVLPTSFFAGIEAKIALFQEKPFQELSSRHRFRLINSYLLELIQEEPDSKFLLPAVLDYIRRVNELRIYEEPYTLSLFEFWLNLFSELSPEDLQHIRGKIVGKMIPREGYQALFPIGMSKTYSGSHFVAAHLSPDIDTTVASFFGWLDAFGAKVGEALHLWYVPGGPSDNQILRLFDSLFGPGIFQYVARTSIGLSVAAQDLLTQKGMIKTKGNTSTFDIDHTIPDKALVYVDDAGYYLGDWRVEDIELIRHIGNSFKTLLHTFENSFHIDIISLFSKEKLNVSHFPQFLKTLFEEKIETNSAVKELGPQDTEKFSLFLTEVLKVEKGLNASFAELLQALGYAGIEEAPKFYREVQSLPSSSLFGSEGELIENRTNIFHVLEKLIELLDIAIKRARGLVDRLDIVMLIKEMVLKIASPYLTMKNDVDEIKEKMRNYNSLTVVIPEAGGRLFPVGVVKASELRKDTLGTVSLRDFSNLQEIHMPSYLQVISVVDHHKISLTTLSQPQILMGDAQSCNILLAEVAFKINDAFSLGGMTIEAIELQLKELQNGPMNEKTIRLLERVLSRKKASQNGHFWVAKEREWSEYYTFIQAILDDTDLLSKVSDRDVLTIASLLNRLKSLSVGKEVEIIDLSDLPRDSSFAKKGAERILKNNEMYSIYKRIYDLREGEIEESMLLSSKGLPSNFFADTKEQNVCCRVGQTKLFADNFKTYNSVELALKERWFHEAREKTKNHPMVDFHLHMLSTIPSAESVHQEGLDLKQDHFDEIWFWISGTQESEYHLSRFLSGFRGSKEAKNNTFTLEIFGKNGPNYREIFKKDFLECKIVEKNNGPSIQIAVLKFKPGSINSRKSSITPFLPRQL